MIGVIERDLLLHIAVDCDFHDAAVYLPLHVNCEGVSCIQLALAGVAVVARGGGFGLEHEWGLG